MISTRSAAESRNVTDTRGDDLRRRRLRHGMSVAQLHRESKVSREAIDAAEAGKASDLTYSKLESWFKAFEEDMGFTPDAEPVSEEDDPSKDLIEFELTGNFGVRVVVKGPIRDQAALEQSVARLLREMRGDS